MQEISSDEGILGQVMDRIKQSARVELAYGESREVGDKTIIPLAVVAYMFGAGSGGGTRPARGDHNGSSERLAEGGGSGGMGRVRVYPVGVLEVTPEETRVVPIIDWTRIITAGLTVFGVWMGLRTIFRRR